MILSHSAFLQTLEINRMIIWIFPDLMGVFLVLLDTPFAEKIVNSVHGFSSTPSDGHDLGCT